MSRWKRGKHTAVDKMKKNNSDKLKGINNVLSKNKNKI